MKMDRADPFLKAVLVCVTKNVRYSRKPTKEMGI